MSTRHISSLTLWATLALHPGPAIAQPKPAGSADTAIDRVLATGDGRSRQTAYVVEGALWEYAVLARLHLRFQSQRSNAGQPEPEDVITARDPASAPREVWFHVARPPKPAGSQPSDPETDRIVRTIMPSGDGTSPESAFAVGGRIEAEYQVMRILGLKPTMQALMSVRGCGFDRLDGTDIDTGATRQVYFNIGRGPMQYGACTMQPATPR